MVALVPTVRMRVLIDGQREGIVWSVIRDLVGVLYDDLAIPWDMFTLDEFKERASSPQSPPGVESIMDTLLDKPEAEQKTARKTAAALLSELFVDLNGGWSAYAQYKPLPMNAAINGKPPISIALRSGIMVKCKPPFLFVGSGRERFAAPKFNKKVSGCLLGFLIGEESWTAQKGTCKSERRRWALVRIKDADYF
eukprot:6196247-Pleurochrysis_carterae.AAC.1